SRSLESRTPIVPDPHNERTGRPPKMGQAGPFVLADPVRGKGLPYLLIHSHLVSASYLTHDLHLPGVPHANSVLPQSRRARGAMPVERRHHADGHTQNAASLTMLWSWPDKIPFYLLSGNERPPRSEEI